MNLGAGFQRPTGKIGKWINVLIPKLVLSTCKYDSYLLLVLRTIQFNLGYPNSLGPVKHVRIIYSRIIEEFG